MKYVYGPVTSRRLGQSLGIDPIPLKTCNWNCVYCQLGRSQPVVNTRKDYFAPGQIVGEVAEALAAHCTEEIDWVTVTGSGEPLLHASLGWIIRQIKAMTELPVAVITNGSLLYMPEVRGELIAADAVLPALDAGSAELYRRINRPHAEVTFERLVQGLVAFREGYQGYLWPEVVLLGGLNDSEQALWEIAGWLECISPDEIHINLPSRPPAETWLEPPNNDALMRALTILETVAPVRVARPVEGTFDLSGHETAVDAVTAVITRHPLSDEELEQALAQWAPGCVQEALAALEASGRAQVVVRHGKRFWTAAASRFPGQKPEHRHAEQGGNLNRVIKGDREL
jgi:wyosine [tRNA(Phe)-imidazoG37] synthetase (radical SAM superfamily)